MKSAMRMLMVELLEKGLTLVVGGLFIVIMWFGVPAYLDWHAGRVTFDQITTSVGLSAAAIVGIIGLTFMIRRLNEVLRAGRQEAKMRRYRSSTAAALKTPLTPVASYQPQSLVHPSRNPAYPAYWPELRQLVLERDHNRCGNCGSTEELHVHHIVPLSLGGTNEMGNLRTLCKSCHQRLHPHMRG